MDVQRELGWAWVSLVRSASLYIAPLDVNLDAALLWALLESWRRTSERLEVSNEIEIEVCGTSSCDR